MAKTEAPAPVAVTDPDFLQAADFCQREAQKYKQFSTVADALQAVGQLDQLKAERLKALDGINAGIDTATTALADIQAKNADAQAENDRLTGAARAEADQLLAKAREDAGEIVKSTKAAGADVVSEAKAKAAGIVSAAEARATTSIAAAEAADAELASTLGLQAEAQAALDELNVKLAKAKEAQRAALAD